MISRSASCRALLTALLAAATACTGGNPDRSGAPTSGGTTIVKVAYFQDADIGDPYPALQGFRLAILKAQEAGTLPVTVEVEVEQLDPQDDPSKALKIAQDVAADPTYVAAVAGSFWAEPDAIGEVLDRAGLPSLGLSTLGPPTPAWTGRFRLVAPVDRQVAALVAYLRSERGSVCLIRDETGFGMAFARRIGRALGGRVTVRATMPADVGEAGPLLERIRRAGCPRIAWAGLAASAATLRIGLSEAGGQGVVMVGPDAVKTDNYLTTTGPAGQGTVVSCACVDLSASTDLAAQVFIHDYQSEFGTAPGIYAAEGWDAGGMLLAALGRDDVKRERVRGALARQGTYAGLANSYAFDARGELDASRARVRLFVDRGERWVALVPAT